MGKNVYFTNEELEILAKLLVISVREVIVADGEVNDEEFAPFSYSIANADHFPIPIVGEVLGYIKQEGVDYVPAVFEEIIENINNDTYFYEITSYGRSVLDNLHRKDKSAFLAGLYGILLETIHSDGLDSEETAASLDVMRSISDLNMKDVYNMNKTWRKKARRFGY